MRVLHAISPSQDVDEARQRLALLIESARIQAISDIVVTDDVVGAIPEVSVDAAVVFLGFDPPDEGEEELMERAARLVGMLTNVILVCNAGDVALES